MIHQATARPFRVRDPHVTNDRDRDRLSAQCVRIVQLFQKRGRVSNRELAVLSLKYTSRLSDLRDAGYLVVCAPDDALNGLFWYTLRDVRMDPRSGCSLSSGLESRTVICVRRDASGRRWVLYRLTNMPPAMGIRRVLLATWRAWATQIPTNRRKRSDFQWRRREQMATAASQPMPRPKRDP